MGKSKTVAKVSSSKKKVTHEINIRQFNWTEKQRAFIEMALKRENKVIFIDAPAGVGKGVMSVYCSLRLLAEKRVKKIYYVRTVVESASRSLGFLKGSCEEKMDPYMIPLMDKLNELIDKGTINNLINSQTIEGSPVNFLRGASFKDCCITLDESQNFTLKELTTAMTRIGEHSKMFIIGDRMQSDINGKSGFGTMMQIFANEESEKNGIKIVRFGIEDIMRSGICKFIVEKIEEHNKITNQSHRLYNS